MDELEDRWIKRDPRNLDLFTPHLMGTARMGTRPADSVVDLSASSGISRGVTSPMRLFPTAIGVNPQITIMALATHVASRLAETLGKVRAA